MGGSNAHPVLELNQQRPVFRNYRLLMNGTLFISKASENDEGKFICEADNGVNEPIGKMVTLKINGKPSQSPRNASLEDSYLFVCAKIRKILSAQLLVNFLAFFSAPPKFDVAHAGPVTGRTGETLELVCEAAGDDHIK